MLASENDFVERADPTAAELLTLVRVGVQVAVKDICADDLLIVAMIF
jgi:hypothetical protein|tara:strand:- start:441 stop:581 length:141 start_codon:yes stop_codon:yes gene_type:complete